MIKKIIKKLFYLEDRIIIHKVELKKSDDDRVNRYVLHCLIDELNKMNVACEYALRNLDLDRIGLSAKIVAEAKVVSRMMLEINRYSMEHKSRIDGKPAGDGFVAEN